MSQKPKRLTRPSRIWVMKGKNEKIADSHADNGIIPIQNLIYEIRGQKIMPDRDLAVLYEVEVKRLNEAVKRNIERFPEDFMFRLTKRELAEVVAKCDHLQSLKFRSTLPYAFTEHGVLMLSNVLNSKKAVSMSIQIIRVFDKLRKYALGNTSTEIRIEELRKLLMLHIENNDFKFTEYDEVIKQIALALNSLIEKPKSAKTIGFRAND